MSDSISELAILPTCLEDISLLATSDDYVILHKPAGLLTVPGRHPANHDCAISRLQRHFPIASVVHRLDFDTSGVMVFALNKASHRHIAMQFQARTTHKCYTAIVAGQLSNNTGEIDLPIAPDPLRRPRYKVCQQQGKNAVTRYEVLSYDAEQNTSRLYLYPVTGRSHQLRLHLSAIGHPILGCAFYADELWQSAAPRLLLHATRLGFQAPGTGEYVEYFCDCPF
ncbi:MAG TPA: RluA family pseudouridine synthase [Cellvibrionaceae bacterium]